MNLTVQQFNRRIDRIETMISRYETAQHTARQAGDREAEAAANKLLNRAREVWAKLYASDGEAGEPFEYRMHRAV